MQGTYVIDLTDICILKFFIATEKTKETKVAKKTN